MSDTALTAYAGMLNDAEYLRYIRYYLSQNESALLGLTDEEFARYLWYRCKISFMFWLRWFGIVIDNASGVITRGLTLWRGVRGYPGQPEFAARLAAGHDIITGKSRQLGISWLCTNFDCWDMLFNDNIRLAVIAQNDDYAVLHITRLRDVYGNQPPFIVHGKQPVVGFDNQHTFGIGSAKTLSVCSALVPDPSTARGIAARRIRCEELAYWDNADAVYLALRGSTADAGRQVLIVSTANGEGNKYHELWQRAESGALPNLHPMFFPWDMHPGRPATFKHDMVLEHGAMFANQEWPDNPEQMFIASGARVFDAMLVAALRDAWACEPAHEHNGHLHIFREPEPGRQYVTGWDIANGGGDATVGHVLDMATGEQVARYSSHIRLPSRQIVDNRIEPSAAAHVAADLAKRYNWAYLTWEDNSLGVAFGAEMQRHIGYPNLYARQNETSPDREKWGTKPGWLTTAHTRGLLFGGLQRALVAAHKLLQGVLPDAEHGAAIILRDSETYRQLNNLVYAGPTNKPQAPSGEYDDDVMALGITEQARQYALRHGV